MKLDTVTLEVIRNALPAVANEMAADLQRTSYNMMIYEVRDYCTALLDTKGELISQNVGGVSHFVADLGVLVTDGMQRYGRDGFKPGDVIITNHQAVAGQHLNNVVIYMPYFYKGELLMFPMVRAHWIDVGGTSTGFGAGATGGRSVARRAAARPAQDLRGGQARRDALSRHQGQHPLSGILARRHEIADGGLPARGAAARRAVRQVRPRHHARRDRADLRRDRAEVPQRGGAAPGRRLRGRSLDRRRRRHQGRGGADPRQGHGQGRRHDDRPVRLLGRAQGRDQLAHLCRRARRLQGADRAARSGQRRLVPRAQGHHPRRQHHDGALSGADGGLERHRADRGRHHRRGARRRHAGPRAGRPPRPARRRGGVLRHPSARPGGASWCRASRAAAGAAGRSRTA